MTLDPTLLSRLKALHASAVAARPNNYTFNSESCKRVAIEVQALAPQLLAHIEAQDKRLSAVSGLVEALEQVIYGIERYAKQTEPPGDLTLRDGCRKLVKTLHFTDAAATLAAWRKSHG